MVKYCERGELITASIMARLSKRIAEDEGFLKADTVASVDTMLYKQATDNATTKYLHIDKTKRKKKKRLCY